MAKRFTCFAPGMAAITPTPDYCEFIAMEQRQNASSERSVIFGSSCGRFCHNAYLDNGTMCRKDTRRPVEFNVEIWGAGGQGGVGCCCQQRGIAGGGGYMKECINMRLNPHDVTCYVVPHGGCCRSSLAGCNGCWALFEPQTIGFQNKPMMLVNGGRCGRTCCYAGYCCFDQTPARRNPFDSDNATRVFQHTIYHWEGNRLGKFIQTSLDRRGFNQGVYYAETRKPWLRAKSAGRRNWNCIPYGGCCKKAVYNYNQQAVRQGCDQLPGSSGERCGAGPAECMNFWRNPDNAGGPSSFHGMSFQGYHSNECNDGCAAWGCGAKPWTQSHNGRRATVRWVNLTVMNQQACGGWNWSQWHLCHNGSNNNLCYQNIRTVGFGGHGADVCGAPCCCGGWGGNGAMTIRYKQSMI